jgi:16S rRNA (guanine527-N7)-methyltransferase
VKQLAERLPLPEPHLDGRLAERLERFLDLLLLWTARINLIAERDREVIRARHLADSLQMLPLMQAPDGPFADLGSGGGFPGLVLAAATNRPTHLVESDRRKAAFLLEAAARLGLDHVTVHSRRIEEVSLPPLAILSARALAPLPALLLYASRMLQPEGIALFPKGRTAEAELEEARQGWTFQVERFTSRTDPSATILRLSDIRRAGTA